MTARTIVHERATDLPMREMTLVNVRKVTRFREGGMEKLEEEVRMLERQAQSPKNEDAEEEEWEDVDDDIISIKEAQELKLAREREADSGKIEAMKSEIANTPELDSRKQRRLQWKLNELERRKEESLKGNFPVSLAKSIRVGGSRKRRRMAKKNQKANVTLEA